MLQDTFTMVVDASANAFVLGRDASDTETISAFDSTGRALWTATPAPGRPGASLADALLLHDGSLAVTDYRWDPSLPPYDFSNRSTVSETGDVIASVRWIASTGETLVSPSGAMFLEDMRVGELGLGWSFGGIARVGPDGGAIWKERGSCPTTSDAAPPHAFALRGSNLFLACDADHEDAIQLREVDEDDRPLLDTKVVGSLASDVVVALDGHAFLLAGNDEKLSMIDVAPDGSVQSYPLCIAPFYGRVAMAGVALDGTFVSFDSEGIVAVKNGQVRWRTPVDALTRLDDLVVDANGSVVLAAGDAVSAFDGATGASLWSVPLLLGTNAAQIAPAGPGKLYVLSLGTLTLLAD